MDNRIHGITIGLLLVGAVLLPRDVSAEDSLIPNRKESIKKAVLSVVQTADLTTALPSDLVTYTVRITNSGDAAATQLMLKDVLPVGFMLLTNDKNIYVHSFSDPLDPGKTITTSYTVRLANDLAEGVYSNVVSVTALLAEPITAQSTITVTPPIPNTEKVAVEPTTGVPTEPTVLGATDDQTLPATGMQQLDVFFMMLGAMLISSGVFGLRRSTR